MDLYLHVYIYLSVYLSIYPYIYLSIYIVSVCLSRILLNWYYIHSIIDYTIRLTPVESRRRQNGILVMTVGPDVTIVIFGNLEQGVAYDVTVSGFTEEGEGTTSEPFPISTIPTEGTVHVYT